MPALPLLTLLVFVFLSLGMATVRYLFPLSKPEEYKPEE